MPKRAIRIPPLKKGRRLRWTFEVSADVDGKKSARASSPSKKTARSRPKRRTSRTSSSPKKTTVPTPLADQTSRSKEAAIVSPAPVAHSDSRAIAPKPLAPRRAVSAGTSRSRMIALAAIATLVVAVLALPRRSALAPGAPLDDSRSEVAPSAPTAVASSSAVAPTPLPPIGSTVKPEAAARPAAESIKKPAESVEHQVSSASKRLVTPSPVLETHDKKATPESPRADAISATTVSTPLPVPAPIETSAVAQVTITGCLEAAAKDRFRLNDTEGANAPKARSWRTGFLKKHSAAVDLVGAHDLGALQAQVGKRVAVTGVQTDRELRVSSLRVVAPACE